MDKSRLGVVQSLEVQLEAAIRVEEESLRVVEQTETEQRQALHCVKSDYREKRRFRQQIERLIEQVSSNQERASKTDVLGRARKLLADNPDGIRTSELKPFVQDSLRDSGFVLTGAFRHWQKWIAEMDDLAIEQDRYRLTGVKE